MDKGLFSAKHEENEQPDERIRAAVDARTADADTTQVPCAVAFEVAAKLDVEPAAVGKTLDLMNRKLVKCQLGLFGYGGKKKVEEGTLPDNPALIEAVRAAADEGRLACKTAWEIADRLNVPKLTVGRAAQAAGIRIRQCQLGAFH